MKCQLDILSRLRTPGAVREALTKLPPTLDKTYEGLLQRIDVEEDKILAREILEILTFSFRPLRLQEVCEMLQITPGLRALDESKCLADPVDILSICGSLLTYQKDSSFVALAHHSVKAYLTSELQGKNAYFRLIPYQAHKSLAIKCLTYLSFDAFSKGPCPSTATLQDRHLHFRLLKYAAHRWAFYVRALDSLDDSLWNAMKGFLFSADVGRGNFHAWVQLLIPSANSSEISQTPPLYYAASFGLTEVVQYLLDAGADTEIQGGRCGATPLNIASCRGHYDVAKLLLGRGADPHAVERDAQWSAIDWARFHSHKRILKLLTNYKDGTGDNTLPDRQVANADLTLRRQNRGSLGTRTVTVAHTTFAPPWTKSSESRRLWLSLVILAESNSQQRPAIAITKFARQCLQLHDLTLMNGAIVYSEAIADCGVSAKIAPETSEPRSHCVLIGTRDLFNAKALQLPADVDKEIDRLPRRISDSANAKQYSLVFVAIDEEYAGHIILADEHIASGNSMEKKLSTLNDKNTISTGLEGGEKANPQ